MKKKWGYPTFRPGQAEVITAILAGQDALAVLPTGGGKSLCYQIPALLLDGVTFVVSPLIALMQDQVAGLQARGISATFINSQLPKREVDQRWTDVEFGRYKLVYVAPERFQSELFLARAERFKVALLAVDEAHCISEWGHHFRPDYLKIAEARTRLGKPPLIAVTATAPPEVRADIHTQLNLHDPFTLVTGFDRPNLTWAIYSTENKFAKLLEIIEKVPGTGLVYATTRKQVETWAEQLTHAGITATAYHGGMPAGVRQERQAQWMNGAVRVIVATNAFGMGIDKPDVRFVVHMAMPATLEAYYQEAGRGGRDGHRAFAVLLYQTGDEKIPADLITLSHPDRALVQRVYGAICNLAQLPIGSLPDAPVQVDLAQVGAVAEVSAATVSAVIEALVRIGYWTIIPPNRYQGELRFMQSAEAIRTYVNGLKNKRLAEFVEALLRTVHADAFSAWSAVDLRLLQRRTGLGRARLERGMAFLAERGLIAWRTPDQAIRIEFTEPRTQALPFDDTELQRDLRRARKRLDYMQRYARSVTCRRQFLLAYFGEKQAPPCGACDVCLGRHEPVVITPKEEPFLRTILLQIQQKQNREHWFEAPEPPHYRVDGWVNWLVQSGYIQLDDALAGTFTLTEKGHDWLAQWQPRKAP